jgi:hypothetical protein
MPTCQDLLGITSLCFGCVFASEKLTKERRLRSCGLIRRLYHQDMTFPANAEWNLHYSRWVIDDGEPERHVGETFEWFAVSFWPDAAMVQSVETTKSAIPIADNSYRVNAEVIYISDDTKLAACILDFGLRAICDGVDVLPRGCQKGDYVTGELRLGLPLCAAVYSDELTYQWRVNKVSADLTPYVLDPTKRMLIRDVSAVEYDDISGTEAVKAKSYVLHCSQLSRE